MSIDQLLEARDLTTAHTVLTLVGMFLALYVMQLTGNANEDYADFWMLRWARRGAMGCTALSFLWALYYSQDKGWQPWPPELALIVSVIAILGVRALAIHARIRRDGVRRALRVAALAKRN